MKKEYSSGGKKWSKYGNNSLIRWFNMRYVEIESDF